MKVAGTEVNIIVITDKDGRLIAGFTQDDAIITGEFMALGEKKIGDLRFIQLEDDSVQVVPFREGAVFPIGTMDSTEFVTRFKELQKQKAAENSNNDEVTISSNDTTDDLIVDPLEDVEVEDVKVLEE